MTVTISCVACGGDFRIPESLFATRFAGRETKIKCKKCGGLIVVDGTGSGPARISGRPSAAPGRASSRPGRASSVPGRPTHQPKRNSAPPPAPGRASRPPQRPPTLSGRRSPLASARRISRPPDAVAPPKPKLAARPQLPATSPALTSDEVASVSTPLLEIAASSPVAAALMEQTSTSSASLRALEVPQPLPQLESNASPPPLGAEGAENPAPAMNTEALPAQLSAKAAAVPRSTRRTNWIGIVGGAALALGALVAFAWRASVAEAPTPTSPAISAASEARDVAPALSHESAKELPAPVQSASAQAPEAESVEAPVQTAAPATPSAAPYNEKALEGALHWGLSNAQECHRGGRPVGTAKAILTFGAAGKVVRAELEGEPIASAPVSKCILSFLRSLMIPAFSGPEFTITREITLR